jgi:hypothetical protein
MLGVYDYLSAAVYVPRRNDLITRDIEGALYALEASGFVVDPAGRMRITPARGIPEVTGETPGARTYEGAVTVGQAASLIRRISADLWGQIMLRGTFAIGGRFEAVTAVVCPFSMDSAALFSVHLLFRSPGLLIKDRAVLDRAAHAVEAIDRMQDAFAPVVAFVDTEQPVLQTEALKGGRLPFLPWAGYASPGAVKSLGGGALSALPDWLGWLENNLRVPGASAHRRTKGGGLIWVLPERGLGKPEGLASAHMGLDPWRKYLARFSARA